MPAIFLLAALVIGPLLAETSGTPGAPTYSPDSIANSASNIAGSYSPNSFISIYGRNLAYGVTAISPDDVRNGSLPTVLSGSGVHVLINAIPANMYFVSPTQVNALIPTILLPGPAVVTLVNDGFAGPSINLMLDEASPGFFQLDEVNIIGTHGNGPVITPESPAQGKRGQTPFS